MQPSAFQFAEAGGPVLERTHLDHANRVVTFIGAAELPGPTGELLHAGMEQPIFHVEHGAAGTAERPLNTWRIVHLTETPDPRFAEPMSQSRRSRRLLCASGSPRRGSWERKVSISKEIAGGEAATGLSGPANHAAATTAAPRPAKWKIWLLTMAGLYPLLTALVTVTGPLLGSLPAPVRLAGILPVAVAAMVWVIMPFLTRRFADWLSR
ncbi:hypothetical protein [Nocardia sp. NPDC057030]|uniref:hypothetical protein n=1 Tax=unclassified Nocardia TaxID=2637762 RepID=UPI003638B981